MNLHIKLKIVHNYKNTNRTKRKLRMKKEGITNKVTEAIKGLKLDYMNMRVKVQCEQAFFAKLLVGVTKVLGTALAKAKDFQFDYIVQVSESTKRIIDVVLSFK